jgi:hypothetical protein
MGGMTEDTMSSRKLRVAMDDILLAMTTPADYQSEAYLDLETGGVLTVEDESSSGVAEDDNAGRIDDDPERYAQIPRTESHDEFDLMSGFADSVDEDDIREMLALALRGKGAFGRFRDVVFRYPDLESRWFAMRQEWEVGEAKRWLASLGIEPDYQLRSVEAAPAQQPAPAPQAPKIELLDLLLLGAPDGKTELIGGRVRRQVSAAERGAARQLFKGLARGICEYFGVAWRKRFIENKDTFEMERAHLRLEGTTVVLELDVPKVIWDAFK